MSKRQNVQQARSKPHGRIRDTEGGAKGKNRSRDRTRTKLRTEGCLISGTWGKSKSAMKIHENPHEKNEMSK